MAPITNYGFVIDNRRCIGCHACTVACKSEHDDPIGVNKTWVKYIEKGEFPNTNRNFSVMRCNHCDDSPCTDVCPVTALWEREDGIVDFDPERCIGCKACMQGCPYDALYIDPNTETAAKCNYCSHRVDTGREPACVTVCPEDAIVAGDLENPDSEIARTASREEVQARKPEKGTEPKLFYVDGDEGSTTPGTTAREEHYMWSDAPHQVETEGEAVPDFDLEKAAESLAASDVSLGDAGGSDDADARADGGRTDCGCDSCGCGKEDASASSTNTSDVQSDGGYGTEPARRSGSDDSKGRTERAYELLHEEATRVYDIGEDHYGSWGWEVYSYTWTKGISAGTLLLSALFMLFGVVEPDVTAFGASAFVSGLFLAATGVLLVLDLEQPTRFHWVLLRPNWNSWLVKGAYIISAAGAYLGLAVLGALLGIEAVVHPLSLGAAAVLGAATAVYTAFLFSQSKGRDLWQSPAMPLHMFAQSIVAGGATLIVLGVAGVPGFEAMVGPSALALGAGLVLHAVLVASEIFTPHQTEDAEEAAARITRGRFRTAFWIGGVVVGILLPLAALAVGWPVLAAVAGALALAGLFAFEYCWITAPQTISLA
ncbi:4Fe-4S dicluster domain-containing protein [Halosolutus halophilus]|uniref:4Fe-4S dicluster domain-containing protein n=1 Tax=Halosolutus halophilus TaxID=1552990 RepID=UPI0022352E68|nr:4Fe-4S dicluster domain-containing protein [Halosolutus halophilus]